MAKKAELYEELQKLDKKTKLTLKNTIAEIEAAIAAVQPDVPAEPVVEATETEQPTDEAFAKAGKRSKKVIEEAEAEAERQERKTEAQAETVEVKKGPRPVVRPKIERRGKKYQEAAKLVEKNKLYTLAAAMDLAVKTSPTKFDATVEIHARLGVDPRQADQNIRTTVTLPNGNGKTVRVAVFAPEDDAKVAKTAGADIAGDEEFLTQLGKGVIDFDVLIATPAYMPKLGKFARLLGPKGLMPNPKAGTVTADVKGAVTAAKAGKVEYRVDKQAIVHIGIGKVSFGAAKLIENATTFFDSLKTQKPASLKGTYVKSLAISTSQGPSIKLENTVN
jgi:large subunit ribosomal protein L1